MQLSCSHLTCSRGGRIVFENLSFSLKKGEALLVTGANGSGKTTLLRYLAGLLDGEEKLFFENGEAIRDHIHFKGTKEAVKSHLTLEENLMFWSQMQGENSSSVQPALNFWSLYELRNLLVKILSTGQRQRLALCRLMLMEKRLWLLDEPFTALDNDGCEKLHKLLREHLGRGGLAMIATHDTSMLRDLPDTKIISLGKAA